MASEAALALEDGSVFVGEPFGASVDTDAEVVFNTGITGYQEVATDPSYRGQMVVMTHPQIGNYGIAPSGDESVRPWVAALIVREVAAQPNHWEAHDRLEDFLLRWNVPGLQGVDTRAVVRRLRETGTQRGVLRHSGPGGFTLAELEHFAEAARRAPSVSQLDLVIDVSAVLPVRGQGEVAVLDCGAKWNIVRSLERRGVSPRVFPWNATADEILASKPRGILVSNGPGDPASLPGVVEQVRLLASSGTPVLGICLGHQLLGLAAGARTSRLPYGHHGGNHPVRDLVSGRVTITTQNHEFQVVGDSLPRDSGFEVSHINLNDGSVEGLRHRELPVFSVQYHPEGAPGPQDSQGLFDEFLKLLPLPLGEVARRAGEGAVWAEYDPSPRPPPRGRGE
jgi:carbamoyl-phosphate synthase small subunit